MARRHVIDVQLMDRGAVEQLSRKARRQIPFATSLALNRVGQDAVDFVRDAMGETFTLRNDWEQKGITFEASSKRDLNILVGSAHDYMSKQWLGGEERARSGEFIGVPLVGSNRGRPRETSRTHPSRWPGAQLRKNDRVFITEVGGQPVLAKRKKGTKRGTYKRRVKKRSFKIMYVFQRSVETEARWDLGDQIRSVVTQKWAKRAAEAFDQALRTAR